MTTPDHWIQVPLDTISDVRLGRQRSPAKAVGPNMRPYLRAANVTWLGLSLEDVKEMDFSPVEFETFGLRVGDILLSEASGSASEVGKPAVWNGQIPGCCFQNTLIRVRAPEELVSFLLLHFSKDAITGAFANASKGVGIHHLSAAKLSSWEIVIPPVEEQRRLVASLDSHFTRLDAAEQALLRAQANLKRYRASVLKAAVEGRLVPTEAELARQEGREYEPASVLLARILAERKLRWEKAERAKMKSKGIVPKDDRWKAKYEEPAGPDVSGMPDLPEGWCWATVDQLAENLDSYRVPIKRADRASRQGEFTYYGASGPIDTIDDYLFDGDFLLVAEDGANLLSRSTPIAFQAHGKFWVNNHAHILRPLSEQPLGFLEALFNARNLALYITGTAQPKLPQGAMNTIPMQLPPLSEQRRIADDLESALSIVETLVSSIDTAERRLARLRHSILKWAFEGKLVDQDPNDEPAADLLARIRAAREKSGAQKSKTRRAPRQPLSATKSRA